MGSQLARLATPVLLFALAALTPLQGTPSIDSLRPRPPIRTMAVDERLATDAGLHVGDRVVLAATPGGAGDTVLITALVHRSADPAEVARAEYRIELHLGELQQLIGYGDRVDRFAVAARADAPGGMAAATDTALGAINDAAFGFQAYRSRDIAVQTSTTFAVVSRFHRAIGVITIVASAVFLLCIMLLKVDERRRDVAALRLMGISAASVMRSVVLEAALVAISGSLLGVGIGWSMSILVNWHYEGVYRTPLVFSLVTPGIVLVAVALSLALGVVAGWLAAWRLVQKPPLALFGR